MVACFDAVRLFVFVLFLWTLQSHFTLWPSARTLQCLFEGVCMPQYFRTLPGLDLGWTQCPTLEVALYSVRKVSVSLMLYLQRRCKTFFCVRSYESSLCKLCMLALYALHVCFKTLKLKICWNNVLWTSEWCITSNLTAIRRCGPYFYKWLYC